jgi:hypothetical protein
VNFGTFGDVRMLVALMTLLIGVGAASAQEQERKLIDRLLKPNTSLTNSAQGKKFVATGLVSFDKRVPGRTFYSPQKVSTKTLPSEQAFTPQQFAARHFRAGDSAANLSTRSRLTTNDKIISPPPAPGIRVAPESAASSPVREFPGSRPFLCRGKSQKSLQAHNTPLTIEQVRELLNKSK